jgi:hypothetical protein
VTSLGKADSGQFWGTDGSSWATCSSAYACTSGPPNSGNYARLDANLTDQKVTIVSKARGSGSTGQVGLIARTTSDWNTNLLWVGLAADGTVEIWSLAGGTWTQIGASITTSYNNDTVARTIVANVSGTLLTVSVDGTAVASNVTVPAAPTGATYAGIYSDTTGITSGWPQIDSITVVAGG